MCKDDISHLCTQHPAVFWRWWYSKATAAFQRKRETNKRAIAAVVGVALLLLLGAVIATVILGTQLSTGVIQKYTECISIFYKNQALNLYCK